MNVFERLNWVDRDNSWLFILVAFLMLATAAWAVRAIYIRWHAQESLKFARRNDNQSIYARVPSKGAVIVPLACCAMTFAFWPLYALWDHGEAVKIAHNFEAATGGSMDAHGRGTLETGEIIDCMFTSHSLELRSIPCLNYGTASDSSGSINNQGIIFVDLDSPDIVGR